MVRPAARKMLILSSFPAFDAVLKGHPDARHEWIGPDDRSLGSALSWIRRAFGACRSADYVVFNNDHRRLLLTCALFTLIAPRPIRRCRIVSVDLLLYPGFTDRSAIVGWAKRLAFRQVDLFILYFRDVGRYARCFGVPVDRAVYVPFKVNSWEKLSARRGAVGEGEYVLLAGATHRDHATFVEAVRRTGVPAMLLVPGEQRPQVEQARWYRDGPPPNLKVDFHVDGREETYLRYLERAKIVCLPRFRWDIGCTGISAYLCAMGLGRCVLISRGPGAEDVLGEPGAALFFEPEDAGDLARVLRLAWDDAELRGRIAANGARYADGLRGEERLLGDILAELRARRRGTPPARPARAAREGGPHPQDAGARWVSAETAPASSARSRRG